MKVVPRTSLVLGAALVALLAQTAPAATPVLVSATRLATEGNDRIEDVAVADDGTIYVAGNTAAPMRDPPGGAKTVTLGKPVPGWQYGWGFVARFSPDGKELLGRLQFASGIAKITTVQAGNDGVYVGGYASEGLEPLIAALGGLLPKAGGYEQRTLQVYCPGEHHSEPHRDPANDQRGVPCALRLSADLKTLECGTYLEGWQSVWHVPRPLGEDHWQPTAIGLLPGGDVVVCHDGGYNRTPDAGRKPAFEHFYGVPDYLSRLSPDLKRRAWIRTIYTPPVDPEKVDRYQPNFGRSAAKIKWPHCSLGNTRAFRLRVGPKGNFYVAGWSPTRTAKEPWWSPFLWKFGPDGEVRWKAYTFDPMSGGGDRMGGLVSDAAIRTVAVDLEGNVLASLIGDGGNSVVRYDPRDYTRPAPNLRGIIHSFRGRTLFWGAVVRLNHRTPEVLAGNYLPGYAKQRLRAAWATDLGPLSDGRVLAVGRQTGAFAFTDDAWHQGPGAFLRVYSPDFRLEFSTAVPDVNLLTVATRGSRAAIVGTARPAGTPAERPARGERAQTDGYLMVVDVPARQSERDQPPKSQR